jgi:hypothetical protein
MCFVTMISNAHIFSDMEEHFQTSDKNSGNCKIKKERKRAIEEANRLKVAALHDNNKENR